VWSLAGGFDAFLGPPLNSLWALMSPSDRSTFTRQTIAFHNEKYKVFYGLLTNMPWSNRGKQVLLQFIEKQLTCEGSIDISIGQLIFIKKIAEKTAPVAPNP